MEGHPQASDQRSDKERLLELLRERRSEGVHTSELRRRGISGNPSQRRLDLIEDGYTIRSERESFVGAGGKRRPGARFFLTSEPALGLGGGLGAWDSGQPAAPSEQPSAVEPEGGQLFDVPEPDSQAGNYRDPDALEAA